MAIVVLAGAYLLGSIPFSLLIALAGGVDLRRTGSGNPGGMNIARELGWGPGILASLLDCAKGAVAVLAASCLLQEPWGPGWTAAAAVVGHCYSPPLMVAHFRETRMGRANRVSWWQAQPRWGGKGLATGTGALLLLSPQALLGAIGVFALTGLLHRWLGVWGSPAVARAASLAALTCPAQLWMWHRSWPLLAAGCTMVVAVILKHVPYLALTPHWPDARPSVAPPIATSGLGQDETTAR